MKFVKANLPACFCLFMILILISSILNSCATTGVTGGPDQEHLDAAKRFLRAFNAEELVMTAFKRTMEAESRKQPESAIEVVRRAMADVKGEDFLNIITEVYVRHLTKEQLMELARFAESPTGQRFFQIVIANVMEGNRSDAQNDILSKFSADELTEILKFASSEPFQAMNKAQPEINREMSEAAREFSRHKMREYLEKK